MSAFLAMVALYVRFHVRGIIVGRASSLGCDYGIIFRVQGFCVTSHSAKEGYLRLEFGLRF